MHTAQVAQHHVPGNFNRPMQVSRKLDITDACMRPRRLRQWAGTRGECPPCHATNQPHLRLRPIGWNRIRRRNSSRPTSVGIVMAQYEFEINLCRYISVSVYSDRCVVFSSTRFTETLKAIFPSRDKVVVLLQESSYDRQQSEENTGLQTIIYFCS